MKKNAVVSGLVFLSLLGYLCSESHAAIVEIDDITYIPGVDPITLDVPLTITGGESFAAAVITFSVGDGGPNYPINGVSGTETISVTAVEFQGASFPTVWDGLGVLPFSPAPPLPSAAGNTAQITTLPIQNAAVADGDALAVFTLDLSTVDASRIGEVISLNPTTPVYQNTAIMSTGGPIPLTFEAGSITVAPVPEASTALLMVSGVIICMVLMRRLKHKHL